MAIRRRLPAMHRRTAAALALRIRSLAICRHPRRRPGPAPPRRRRRNDGDLPPPVRGDRRRSPSGSRGCSRAPRQRGPRGRLVTYRHPSPANRPSSRSVGPDGGTLVKDRHPRPVKRPSSRRRASAGRRLAIYRHLSPVSRRSRRRRCPAAGRGRGRPGSSGDRRRALGAGAALGAGVAVRWARGRRRWAGFEGAGPPPQTGRAPIHPLVLDGPVHRGVLYGLVLQAVRSRAERMA